MVNNRNTMFLALDFPKYVKSIDTLAYAMVIGVFVAGILAIFYRRTLGAFIRYLLKQKIHTPEAALRLEDTPYCKSRMVLSAIRSERIYSKVLRYTDADGQALDFVPSMKKLDKKTVLERRYYIPEELRIRAEYMFEKKGNDPIVLIFAIILFIILAIVCVNMGPWLFEKAQNMIK